MTSAIINTTKKLARVPNILGWNRAESVKRKGKACAAF